MCDEVSRVIWLSGGAAARDQWRRDLEVKRKAGAAEILFRTPWHSTLTWGGIRPWKGETDEIDFIFDSGSGLLARWALAAFSILVFSEPIPGPRDFGVCFVSPPSSVWSILLMFTHAPSLPGEAAVGFSPLPLPFSFPPLGYPFNPP